MPVPNSINDLSTNAASNSPAGSESASTIDDYFRAIQAIIKTRDNAYAESLTGWTAYTPVITSSAGTISQSTSTGAFKKIGRTVHVRMQCSIISNGTGAGSLRVTLPSTMATTNFAISGRESGLTGFSVVGVGGGGAQLNVFRYDNAYAGGTGANLILAGTYESPA